ncbi:CCC motif membrane protein [Winogradskyella wichelsiae]|uniref:CCC motif membrane protein n=1 Tax=Winogradskyella wichelsiae TaxID=2697007 RepID=UPI0015CAA62E|nr:CCC motif membrane protein [Winogradskyella wichelsiae]
MEKQQIPNGTLVLVMGILSIVGCCCYGIPGLIFGIVAIVLAGKATKIYKVAPETYSGFGNVKAGKIMGIIGAILSVLMVAYILWFISFFGMEALENPELMQERMQELMGPQ